MLSIWRIAMMMNFNLIKGFVAQIRFVDCVGSKMYLVSTKWCNIMSSHLSENKHALTSCILRFMGTFSGEVTCFYIFASLFKNTQNSPLQIGEETEPKVENQGILHLSLLRIIVVRIGQKEKKPSFQLEFSFSQKD